MLANNNKRMIHKLAKNTRRANRKKFGILFFTIALSAFMLFCIFTTGMTYLDLIRLQNTRLYGAEFDAVLVNGFSDKQKEVISNDPDILTVGAQAYAGHVTGTDADDTVNAGLLWCDDTFWKTQKAPARTKLEGKYPQTEYELLATKETLEECGKGSLTVGDSFRMTFEDNTGIHTKDFVISGIWDGYGIDKSNFYVSKTFLDQSGYNLEYSGILYMKFQRNYVTKETMKHLEEAIGLSDRQVFQTYEYIEKSLAILQAVCGLCLIICLSAYLLIYNILYLSVSGKIRYYGLLQTLGMTKKQLVQFIGEQIMPVGIAGILTGVFLGAFASFAFLPYIMGVLGISLEHAEIRFYPGVLALSVLASGIAVLWGAREPVYTAAGITPLEAARYQHNAGEQGCKRIKRGNLYWKMAKEQLKKGRKETMVVFLSLAVSLTVFYCLTTIISSQGDRTVFPNYWNADFIIRNDTQAMQDMTSIQPAIDDEFMAALEDVDGIKEIHAMKGLPVSFPYRTGNFAHTWIKNFVETKPYMSYDDMVLDYQKNPEKYYGMLKGIDEAEFGYLNGLLGNPIEKRDFMNGSVCIVQYAGFEIPQEHIGDKIVFSTLNKTGETAVGAISYEGYYGASVNIGANLIVSENYLNTLTSEPYILSLNIKYEKPYDEGAEKALHALMEDSPYSNDLSYISRYDDRKRIEDSQSSMTEIGTVIALLLLFVGLLNYINTFASSIQNRKLTFAIMESIGMSGMQIKKLLVREGLLYALGSVGITLTVGTGITYAAFQSMNYMKIPFRIPVVPLLCAVAFVILICVITPLLSYKKIAANDSIVERLRE